MSEPENSIRWPADFTPAQCPVHVTNELAVRVPVDRVWAWLIRAALWPSWYFNSKDICFLSGPPPDLALGTRFRWWTFGVTIESTVREFVPGERIAWDGHAFGVHVYHAWLIRPTQDGCHILTEEVQRGFKSRLGAVIWPTRMSHHHGIWLERLRDNAASGMPPG
ncbi:MAG TPA: SRPBCC family protein [Thermoanaerobaculia bacterium]|jgi:hypothetical protein|nr:SRPBCC family protein [Thermoanaerobaculia bacterium]